MGIIENATTAASLINQERINIQGDSSTSYNVPKGITKIRKYAFYKNNFTSVVIPDDVIIIDEYAFQDCNALISLSIGDSVTNIGKGAFGGCTSLTELTIPDSVSRIDNSAFNGCTSLTKLTIPDSVTNIGDFAFYDCTSLTELSLAQGFNCNKLNVLWSTHFTAETIVACLEALADRTGQTAYTITFGTTNLKKLTPKQKAIATNKNWNLA